MKLKYKELFASLVIVFISTGLHLFLWNNPLALTIIYAILIITDFFIFKNKSDIILFFIGAFCGPLAESLSILLGEWVYSNPNLFLIPSWLPIAWGIWAIFIKRVSQIINK